MDKNRQKYLIRLLDSYCAPMKKRIQVFIILISLATVLQVFAISKLVTALLLDWSHYLSYWYYFVLIVVSFVIKAGAIYIRSTVTQKVAGDIRSKIRKQILLRCKNLGAKGIGYNSTSMSIFYIEQVDLLNNYIARFYPQNIATRIQPLIVLIAVFALNWVAGLVLLFTFPLLPIFMILIGKRTAELNAKQLKSLLYLGNQFHDKMIGIKTIIAFSQQERTLLKMTQSSIKYSKTTVDLLKVAFLNSAVLEFLSAICIAIMALYFGLSYLSQVTVGGYHTGVIVSLFSGFFCLTLAGEFFMPLRDLGAFYHDRSSALNAIDELDKFINQEAVENIDFIDVKELKDQNVKIHSDVTINSAGFNGEVASASSQLKDQVIDPILEKKSIKSNADFIQNQDIEEINEETNLDLSLSSNSNDNELVSSELKTKAKDKTKVKTKNKSTRSKHQKLSPIFLDANNAKALSGFNLAFSLAHQHNNDNNFVKFSPQTIVEISNLSIYTYTGKQLVKNLDAKFKLSQKVAIIGLSGAGKTTFISALLGLYPYTGSIKFDGIELTDLNRQQFYAYFSWLGQNPNLDQTSILNNLEYKGDYLSNNLNSGFSINPNLNEQDLAFQKYLTTPGLLTNYSIQQAINQAKVDDLVAQRSLDYQIQQHNIGLSGGQVQRIALARALSKPHLFLIIDEPTANLDDKLEQAVFNNIQAHKQGILMVTHRIKHTKSFDIIYRLDSDGLHLQTEGAN